VWTDAAARRDPSVRMHHGRGMDDDVRPLRHVGRQDEECVLRRPACSSGWLHWGAS
jgi:hypothetical protein